MLEDSLPGGEDDTFVFVYHRDSGMTDADRATVERHYDTLAERYPPKVAAPTGEEDEGPRTRPSTDGKAMMSTLDVSTTYGAPETIVVVTLLLITTYRSPVLWLVPLVAVGAAALTSMATVYLLVTGFGIVVDDQNSALLTILVFGVGTDYALRGAAPAIVASAATVIAGLFCLLVADLNSTSGLGPIGAAGILCALVAVLTLFPAMLVVLGRRIFWPAIPRFGTAVREKPGLWVRLGAAISRRRWVAALGSLGVLGVLAIGLTGSTGALGEQDQFVSAQESVTGFTAADDDLYAAGAPGAGARRRQGHSRRGSGRPGRVPRRLGRHLGVPDGRAGHRRGVRHDQAGAHRRARGDRRRGTVSPSRRRPRP
ncbi:MMPL family transporter [Saccharothrix syringae]|uniref:MMPL family transporter n=1 Tax=Saccharothrix syringae TaxID=103733 RepID=UPI00068B1492|nr:MMPL family transporter [Saccharothrix syringae]